jgi:hypothetical protein
VSVEPPDDYQWLSTADASARTGIPAETLRKWRDEGRGPAFKQDGRFYFYREDDLEPYVRQPVDTIEAGRQDADQQEPEPQFVIPDGWQDWEPVTKVKARLTVLGSAPMHGHWACPLCDSRWDPYRWHKGFLNLPTMKPPGLVVSETLDGHAYLVDQGGHSQDAILRVLGLTADDLRPTVTLDDGTRAEAVYTYRAMDGATLYEKLVAGDRASWRHQGPDGWQWGTGNQLPTFFRRRDVEYAKRAGARIFLAVDEQAVLKRLRQLKGDNSIVPTTVPGGLQHFNYRLADELVGCFPYVLIDPGSSPEDRQQVPRIRDILRNAGLEGGTVDPSIAAAMTTTDAVTAKLRDWSP